MANGASIQDIYREVLEIKQHMISKEELAGLLETLEILRNPETMRQIRESEENIREGKIKPVRGVKDILDESGE